MKEYINRGIVIKRFEQLKNESETLQDRLYLDGVISVLECVQVEDVAPVVHGKWKSQGKDKISDVYRCSNCNIIIGLQFKTKYCPNCGAKMDLE